MPFTPSHIVAILPLYYARKSLPLSALAIGCMIPDLPLFFDVGVPYSSFHSLSGTFVFSLPFGLAAWALYTWVLKVPLYALLPDILQRRIAHPAVRPLKSVTLRHFGLIALCIVGGALSHVAWDAFTHHGRWGANLIPALCQMHSIGPFTAHGTTYLQYASSLLGLGVILPLVIWRILTPRRTTSSCQKRDFAAIPQLRRLSRWSLILFLTVSGCVLAWVNFARTRWWDIPLSERIRFMITDTVASEFWVILSYCAAFYALRLIKAQQQGNQNTGCTRNHDTCEQVQP